MTFDDENDSNTCEIWILEEHDGIGDYFERFEFFLAVNKVPDEQKVLHLSSELDVKIYTVFKNLPAPWKLLECTLAQIAELLIS